VGAEVLVRHWLVGVCRHTNQLHYSQFFLPTAPGNPGQIGGTLNGTFWDGYTGPRFDYHGLEVDPLVGLTYALDDLFLEQRLSSAVLPRHTLTSLKTNFGLTLGVPVYQSLDLRLGAYHTTSFKTGDADSNTRLSFGLRTYIPSF
jgi:hypothetical protein